MKNASESIAASLTTLRMLWGSFLVSLCIFGVVLSVVPLDGDAQPTLLYALSGAALFEVPMVFGLRFLLMGPSMGLLTPNDLRENRIADDASEALLTARQKYQTGSLIGFAMSESIAIMGFVCTFLSAQPVWYAGWASVAVVLYLIQFPRAEGILALMDGPERKRVRQQLGQ